MKIQDKTPEQLLINDESLKLVISSNADLKETKQNFENSKNLALSFSGGLLSCVLAIFSSWGSWNQGIKVISIVLTMFFSGFTLWNFVKWKQSHKN